MKHLAFHQSLFLPNEEVGLIFFFFKFLMICCFPVVTVAGLSVESYVVSCSVEHDYSFLGASLQPQFQKDGTLKFITPEKNLRKYTVFIQTKVILNLMATIYNLKKSWDKYNKKDVYRGNSKPSGDC